MTEPVQYHFTLIGTLREDGYVTYTLDFESAYWPDGTVYDPNAGEYGEWRTETEDDQRAVTTLINELERLLTRQS